MHNDGREYRKIGILGGRHNRPGARGPMGSWSRFCPVALLVAMWLGASGVALAHHSFAMFDKSKQVELTGLVTKFEWTNPHSYITISVRDGVKAQEWTIETGAPGSLIRLDERWSADVIKAGDTVKVTINPLKSGQPGGALIDLITPKGLVLGQHAPKPNAAPPQANDVSPAQKK
jgi:Family of unknown function (DUF6152)